MKTPIAAMLMASLAWPAMGAPAAAPAQFMIDGKPAPLACLKPFAAADSSSGDPVSIVQCSGKTPDDAGPIHVEGDMVGYDDKSDSGYFYYRELGVLNGLNVLFIQNSGGGTGHFSLLAGIRRTGDTLQMVKVYAGGDRCNGTVSGPAIRGVHVYFDSDGTPADMVALGDKATSQKVKLEDSAQSCVASFHWQDDAVTGVSLTEKSLKDQSGWTERFANQSCFNHFYNDAVARKETELTKDQLTEFVQDFVKTCAAAK